MQVHTCGVVLGILQHTVFIEIVAAHQVVDGLAAATHRNRVVGLSGIVTCALIHPVGGGKLLPTTVVIVGVVVEVRVSHPRGLLLVPLIRSTGIITADIDPLLLLPCRQTLGHVGRGVHGIIAIIRDLGLTLLAALRGNQHHAGCCAGTVDSTGRGILQYRDTLDIIGVEQRQITLNTVDQDQCRGVVHRRESTDTQSGCL